MNQLSNCRKCGKLYLRVRNICAECYQAQETDYLKVVDYLRDVPGTTMQELSDETNVSISQIREFILAGRIILTTFPNLGYPCESCGTTIKEGKACNSCVSTINQLANNMEKREKVEIKRTSGYKTHI